MVFDVFAVFGTAISQADEPMAGFPRPGPVIRATGSAVAGEVRVLVRAPADARADTR
ncbi:hypothetical protein tb265_11370 [Gemmatimonadetes bacterium T265]|nr:hypothetical protein tb265_11370 [Gemmatimonadetes bacterium T265]